MPHGRCALRSRALAGTTTCPQASLFSMRFRALSKLLPPASTPTCSSTLTLTRARRCCRGAAASLNRTGCRYAHTPLHLSFQCTIVLNAEVPSSILALEVYFPNSNSCTLLQLPSMAAACCLWLECVFLCYSASCGARKAMYRTGIGKRQGICRTASPVAK